MAGNSARYGGGVYGSDLTNCIVYFNDGSDWANYDATTTLSYCCTTPQPSAGRANLTADPQLAGGSHLSASSPCRGAGSSVFVSGVDIDGEPWATPSSIGCDEYHLGALGGPLKVDFVAAFTNVAVGRQIAFKAVIDGRASASVWTFGDGVIVTNRPYADHGDGAPGERAIRCAYVGSGAVLSGFTLTNGINGNPGFCGPAMNITPAASLGR